MKIVRLALIGFGVVGRGFAELLEKKQADVKRAYDIDLRLVGVGNARHGFVYNENGLDIERLLKLAAEGKALSEYPVTAQWRDAVEGLRATRADVLVEATPTNLRDGEPGMSHMRVAFAKHMHVVTANKGPGALAAGELFALARDHGVQLRMESTVMAGTPVLSTIREGMAGAKVMAIRGILNGTTNYILSAMAGGRDYQEVLEEAQAKGYAETDPTADVEGYDTLAKTLILAALAFNHPLSPEHVSRQGITKVTQEEMQEAIDGKKRIKLIASLRLTPGANGEERLEARVEPLALPLSDPLARVDGAMNAISIETDTLAEVTVIGPGAGSVETAQGLLADVIACTR